MRFGYPAFFLILGVASVMTAAMLSSCRRIEKAEDVTAEVTAAQMEGRTAARRLLYETATDSATLRRRYDQAASPGLAYDTLSQSAQKQAFDSTFRSTVRTIRPDIMKKLGL